MRESCCMLVSFVCLVGCFCGLLAVWLLVSLALALLLLLFKIGGWDGGKDGSGRL